jgi:predicted RecB family nuclease
MFNYRWKYCSNSNVFPVTSNETFQDIVTCYYSFVDFHRKIQGKEKLRKLEIMLTYSCKSTKYELQLAIYQFLLTLFSIT